MRSSKRRFRKRKLSQEDVRFLHSTNIFSALPEKAAVNLLACMAPMTIKAGERFIRQGEDACSLYLIQEGSCTVTVEKEGIETPLARLTSGDLLGEIGLCTGDKTTSHVDAETDMKLWCMSKTEFDEMCLTYPDLREFCTEVVSRRIAGSAFVPHRTIGKYMTSNVIGQGGWAVVYKGVHTYLDMPAAIKMLKHDMAMDSDFLDMFLNEAKVIAGLNHPNIVRVHDVEQMYRTAFIVMEYLSGQSLEDILQNKPSLNLSQIVNYLAQVVKGLEYAHKKGIVHQDIKPANIFVEMGDKVKIIDFGLACPTGSEDSTDLAGTPDYMAPEQIAGEPVDARTDIYALGITAFEMATGQKPFEGKSVIEIMNAHAEEQLPCVCSLNPDLPFEFNEFIQKATQKDPTDRYQSATAVLEDLVMMAEKHNATDPFNAEGRIVEASPSLDGSACGRSERFKVEDLEGQSNIYQDMGDVAEICFAA